MKEEFAIPLLNLIFVYFYAIINYKVEKGVFK